jgi:hypothetical protein
VPGSPLTDLGEGFVRQQELIEQLREDIASAYSALEECKSSQYLRRCVVRSIFAFIEAAIEAIKWELRSSVRLDEFTGQLSEREKETLGSLHVVGLRNDKFLPLDQNIKRTFRLAAKIWQLKNFRLNTDGEDFQDFLRAKSARNRLTHPKTVHDIEVTDVDMHCHTIAGMWVQTELFRLFKTRIGALAEGLPESDREQFIKELPTQ